MDNRPSPLLMILGIFIILLSVVSVDAGSNFTSEFDRLFFLVTVISSILALSVLSVLFYFIYKYKGRSEEGAKNLSSTTTRKLELSWTLLATAIIVILMITSYPVLVNSIDNNEQQIRDKYGKPTEIIVEGTQTWHWVFHTQNQTIHGNQFSDGYPRLNLTVGKPYKFIFWASGQWIHSFFVRKLDFKMDVVPGVNNTMTFVITNPGTYLVLCNEYCGPGHPQMRAYLVAR